VVQVAIGVGDTVANGMALLLLLMALRKFELCFTAAAFAAMIPLFAVSVLEAILARRSFSKSPTVTSSETNDSTERASSPTTVGTAASFERIE